MRFGGAVADCGVEVLGGMALLAVVLPNVDVNA